MIPRRYKVMLACAFFLMRLLDKIYEGKDIWEADSPWWDMIE